MTKWDTTRGRMRHWHLKSVVSKLLHRWKLDLKTTKIPAMYSVLYNPDDMCMKIFTVFFFLIMWRIQKQNWNHENKRKRNRSIFRSARIMIGDLQTYFLRQSSDPNYFCFLWENRETFNIISHSFSIGVVGAPTSPAVKHLVGWGESVKSITLIVGQRQSVQSIILWDVNDFAIRLSFRSRGAQVTAFVMWSAVTRWNSL